MIAAHRTASRKAADRSGSSSHTRSGVRIVALSRIPLAPGLGFPDHPDSFVVAVVLEFDRRPKYALRDSDSRAPDRCRGCRLEGSCRRCSATTRRPPPDANELRGLVHPYRFQDHGLRAVLTSIANTVILPRGAGPIGRLPDCGGSDLRSPQPPSAYPCTPTSPPVPDRAPASLSCTPPRTSCDQP